MGKRAGNVTNMEKRSSMNMSLFNNCSTSNNSVARQLQSFSAPKLEFSPHDTSNGNAQLMFGCQMKDHSMGIEFQEPNNWVSESSRLSHGWGAEDRSQSSQSVLAGFLETFKNIFSRLLPENASKHSQSCPSPSTPARPHCTNSGSSHPSKMSDQQIAQSILNNFDAFEDPAKPGFITQKGLRELANQPLTGRFSDDQNILLAREVLKRPELNKLMDQDSVTGKQDGLIDRKNLEIAAKGGNPFSASSDNDLAKTMLENFGDLRDDYWTSSINIEHLKELAQKPLAGEAGKDRNGQLAREVLSRPELLKKMDNYYSKDNDGWIRSEALISLNATE